MQFAPWNALWLASGAAATRRFRAALRDPAAAQERILLALLRRNADCEYGRQHGFGGIRSAQEYQERVPVVRYAEVEPHIRRIMNGEQRVLTSEPVLMLEKTGGSTSASKYIPYTRSLKREFGAAVSPWMADLYGHRPQLLRCGAYWSVSPAATQRERTAGGLPVGFDEDADYFGPLERWVLRRLMLTPRELPLVADIESSRYVTLRFLVQSDRLGFISVWNPSFLTLLMESLQRHAGALIRDIEQGTLTPPLPLEPDLQRRLAALLRPLPARARWLRDAVDAGGTVSAARIWPRLRVISCWTDAAAAQSLPAMTALFPGVEIQSKGLLATEGAVSIPLVGHRGAALVVTSHFLEFVPEDEPDRRPVLAHELERDQTYTVLLTTGGGLYRYALEDRVRVTGFVDRTPLIEFLGKADHVCDLRGEKLHEGRVRDVLQAALAEVGCEPPAWMILAPEWEPEPHYVLLIDGGCVSDGDRLAAAVEARLREGHHYDYCRRLGQLGPARAVAVRNGELAFQRRCAELGQRAGSIKPTALHSRDGWTRWLAEHGHLRRAADAVSA